MVLMVSFPFVVLLFLRVQLSIQQTNPWCDPKFQCNGVNNTMCTYKAMPSGDTCEGNVNATTPDVKQRLLGIHNFIRSKFTAGTVPGWPQAANMRQVTWDDTVAEVALTWAFQCQISGDECRKTSEFEFVGQNWGASLLHPDNEDGVVEIMKRWLDGVNLLSGKIVDSFRVLSTFSSFITAMVWADTYKIGCGLVNMTYNFTYENVSRTETVKQTLVCNYAPAGNWDGKPIWTKGDPCSKCSNGTQCNPNSTYINLCASPDDPDDEVPVPIDIPSRAATINPSFFVLFLKTVTMKH